MIRADVRYNLLCCCAARRYVDSDFNALGRKQQGAYIQSITERSRIASPLRALFKSFS